MADKHPLYHAVCLWASEPEKWVWERQTYQEGSFQHDQWSKYGAPTLRECSLHGWRLVHIDWLRDPESVTVYVRYRGSNGVFLHTENPTWDHETHEYRVEPRKRTGRMVEAPEVDSRYYSPNPQDIDWVMRCLWQGEPHDYRRLERGLCYHDADSAIAAAKRMTDNARQGTNGDDER